MPSASLTDDNAVMAEIAGAVFTVISAMLYQVVLHGEPVQNSSLENANQIKFTLVLQQTNHIRLVWQHLQRTAGREDRYTLAAALEECLELLGILQNNQGRSQAAPIAFGGQPEADKVARPDTARAQQQDTQQFLTFWNCRRQSVPLLSPGVPSCKSYPK